MQNTASDHWPQSSLGSRHAVKQRPVTGSAWPTHGVYIMSVCNHSNQLINHPCLCWAPVAQKSSRVQWLIQLGWSLQCVFLFFFFCSGIHIQYRARHCETWEYPIVINPAPRQQHGKTNVWNTCVSQLADWSTWLTHCFEQNQLDKRLKKSYNKCQHSTRHLDLKPCQEYS